jgi:formylglycine-generating enzyme required for sulfatase activity
MKSEEVSASEGAVEAPPVLGTIRSNSKGPLRKTLAVAFIGLALIGCYLDFIGSDHRPQGDAFMASFERNKQAADETASKPRAEISTAGLREAILSTENDADAEALLASFMERAAKRSIPSLMAEARSLKDDDIREVIDEVIIARATEKISELNQMEGYENAVRWLAEQRRLGEIDDDFINEVFDVVKEKARQSIPGVSLQDAWETVRLTPIFVYGLVKGGAKYVPLAIYENWANIFKAREHRKYLGADVIGSSLLYGAYKIVRLTQRSWRALISDIYDYTDEKLRERMVKDIKFYEFMNTIEERAGLRAAVPLAAKIVHDSIERDPEITKPQIGQQWENTLGKAYMIAELNLELIPIAVGSFVMGSPVSESGRHNDEGPQTHVTLTKPFWLGKTEVTQAQWAAIMGNNPSNFKGDNLPVEQVSWNDAMEYCRKLTERLAGRLPVGYVYTLPTEAQWEYACRAGTTGEYAGTGILDEMGWYGKNSENTTHPVGQKNANAWGLHDMHGNVWEWCLDWRGAYPGGKVSDPSGALTGKDRVNRGGGWENYSDNCRSADRMALSSGYTYSDLGFRVALAPIPRREGL